MQDNNTKNRTGIIIGAIVIVVIVVGVIVYAMSNKNDTSTSSNDSSMSQNESVMVGGAAMYKDKNIIENVSNASNLTTLVTAVKAADLVTTLQGPGPFTVFGPDNDAFAKLPAGTVDTLLKPENKTKLQDILKYHVVSGKYLVSDLSDGQVLTTVEGQNLKVTKSNGKTMINNATISTGDVLQSNGVAHVIDTVLLPEETTMVGGAAMYPSKDIVTNVSNASNLTTLVTAVKAADLVATLQGTGPFTVFGPDNNAFAKLPAGTVDSLLKPENKAQLQKILTYHVVSGKYLTSDLKDGQVLTTVQGEKLTIKKTGSTITISTATSGNIATITTPDVLQSNGVAHVIDTVLLPS